MKRQNSNPEEAGNLRQKAEEQLKLPKPETISFQEADMLKLIHELQVHQIELEMQNEEHAIAKEKAELAEEKYTALFEFAPSPYFNLTPDGEISELNLAGAKMLGKERMNLISRRLVTFMSSGTSVTFHDFLLRVFAGKSPASCEVAFLTNGDIPIYALLSGTLAGNEKQCLVTAVDITDRKHAEKSLKDSEIKYRTLADSGGALIWTSGTDKLCDYFNAPWLKFTGRTLEQEMGNGWTEGVHPDDFQYCVEIYNGAFDRREPFEMEYRLRHHDGSYRWILDQGTPRFDSEGNFIGYMGYCYDINTKRQAEELMIKKLQLEKLHRMINEESLMSHNHSDFINFSLRTLGSFLSVSRTYIFEYDDKTDTVNNTFEWCAEGVTHQIHELVNFNWDELPWWRDTLAGGIINYSDIEDIPDQVSKEILRPQGILSILVVPLFKKGKLDGFIGFDDCSSHRKWDEESIKILLDISILISKSIELDNSKTALSENERKFRMLYETMVQGVVYQGTTGAITHANPAAERILGLSQDQMQGRTSIDPRWHTIQQDGSPFPGNTHPAMIALATGKENKAVMGVFNPTEEKYKWINVNAIPEFRNGEDKPFRVFTTFEDITELKNAIDELNKAKELLEVRVEERTKEILEISGLQKAILANAPIAIMTINERGIYQSINPAGEKMLGYSASEVVGKLNPFSFHDKEEMLEIYFQKTGKCNPSDEDLYHTVLEYIFHKTTEWTWIRKNGEKFPIRITHSSIIDENGVLHGYMGLISDITQEKLAIESLRESEERFHKMFQEHSAVMLLINPENGDILQANDTAVAYYGLDFTGTTININDINALSPSKIKEEMEKAVKQRRNYFIFPHRLANGEIRTIEVHSTPIEVRGKKVLFSIIHDITERKLAEEGLKKSVAENRAIIQAVPDMMFRIKRDGTFLDSHNRNESSLYVPKELFTGKKVSEVLPPKLARQSMQAIGEAFTSGEVVQFEYILAGQKKDNYFENRMIAISGDEVLSIIRDITYRKESEAALKMQTVAFEAFSLAIIITDIKGRIEWANSAFTKLTGYSAGEAIGKMPGELVKSGKQDKQFTKTFWDTLLSKKVWSGELINRRKDGSLYSEEQTITPVLDTHGNISSFIAIKIDITERKQLYQELADEKRRLADIINGTNVGTWEWNIQTGETIFNQQWAQMLGYTLEEISPVSIETWMKFAHSDDLKSSGELLQKHFNGDLDHYSVESRMKHKNGEWIWVMDRGKVHKWDEAGKPILMSGTHFDITRQKRIEAALLAAKNEAEKANLAKSEFLSRMSHELRTPMNSILGFAQLLEMGELTAKQKKGVAHIMNSGKHLLDLINEVLDISSIEAGRQIINQEPVELISIINETTESIEVTSSKKRVTIEVLDSPDTNHFVLADRLRLKQILINLLYNAIKYNNEGGSVTIQTKLQPADEQSSRQVRISVSDTGMGINPEDIGKLFTPFERIGADRTETEGTGLGLMVVKKLTEAMGGRVGVESAAGAGSTFWIELPLAGERQPGISQSAVSVKPGSHTTQKSITILYIEDNQENIELVEEIIEEHRPGIRLVTSTYGRQTVRLAKEHQPGLILLDLNLPDVHGNEVLLQLNTDAETKAIPVIIISADAMPLQVDKLMKEGATGYLTKPLDIVAFLKTIDHYIKN